MKVYEGEPHVGNRLGQGRETLTIDPARNRLDEDDQVVGEAFKKFARFAMNLST